MSAAIRGFLVATGLALAAVPAPAQQVVAMDQQATTTVTPRQTDLTKDERLYESVLQLTKAQPGPAGFSVVLVLGDVQGSASIQNSVPAAARRALADMKDFLPYSAYHLLDAQWMLCCSGSGSAITRLRGADDQEYELELRAAPDGPGRLSVRFRLREPGSADAVTVYTRDEVVNRGLASQSAHDARQADVDREIFRLERERVDLQLQIEKGRSQVEAGTKDPAEVKRLEAQYSAVTRRIADLGRSVKPPTTITPRPHEDRAVIDTSFRMDIGETVVVGTSRVKAGKALIALLTAVPQRPKTP
jgi:hypothetical protein